MFGWKKMFSYFLAFQDMQEFHFHFSDRDSRITCFFFQKSIYRDFRDRRQQGLEMQGWEKMG